MSADSSGQSSDSFQQRFRSWRNGCLAKKRYFTYKDANKVGKRATKRRGVPLRVYHCRWCNGYHLTKQR